MWVRAQSCCRSSPVVSLGRQLSADGRPLCDRKGVANANGRARNKLISFQSPLLVLICSLALAIELKLLMRSSTSVFTLRARKKKEHRTLARDKSLALGAVRKINTTMAKSICCKSARAPDLAENPKYCLNH